jgi:hypothetical protein
MGLGFVATNQLVCNTDNGKLQIQQGSRRKRFADSRIPVLAPVTSAKANWSAIPKVGRRAMSRFDTAKEPSHRKKSFSIFPSPAGMSLTKLSLGGNNDVI